MNADAIIHFGHACLSKVSRLPVHYVFMNFAFDSTAFVGELNKILPNIDGDIVIFVSSGYFYHLGI